MNKYTGKSDIDSILAFLQTNTTIRCEPMSDAKIKVLKNAFPGKEIPKQYISFLMRAGDYFELWKGSDYILVNDNNQFINLALQVQNDPNLDALFKKFGFTYNECLFFFSHQGNSYLFFSLTDSNDTNVYILDADIESDALPKTTFPEYIIDSYNSYVTSHEVLDNPWRKCRNNIANRIVQDIAERFYEKESNYVMIPCEHDKYVLNDLAKLPHNFMTILNPILKEMVATINSVYMFSDGIIYIYFPNKNSEGENTIGFNLYGDKNFIIGRDYDWGWIVQGKNVFVFGDKFRSLVKHIISELISTEGGKK